MNHEPAKWKSLNKVRIRYLWKKWWLLIVFVGLVLVFGLTYALYWVPGSGFGGRYMADGKWQPAKTFWDWMDLLLVPGFLALGALLLTGAAAKREREFEDRRARDQVLQTYFDNMTDLLMEGLRESRPDDVKRTIARARTLTVFRQLDKRGKGTVLEFLYESGLIGQEPVLDLSRADLRGVVLDSQPYLRGISLYRAYLFGAFLPEANLAESNLQRSLLQEARLFRANLRDADLREVNFIAADLRGADLHGADLREADLEWAGLCSANLLKANLEGAALWRADLRGAKVTQEQLAQAMTLEDAILPDGTKYTG